MTYDTTLQYHGGTNFGRTAGGPFIATSYDYDAPIDEYGEPNTFTLVKGMHYTVCINLLSCKDYCYVISHNVSCIHDSTDAIRLI